MIYINEEDLKNGAYFTLPFKPEKAKRMLAQKYGKNPDDFEYDQANNRYVYKPKRNYGKSNPQTTNKAATYTATNPSGKSDTDTSSESDDGFFKVTVSWMQEHYDKFNEELFGGQLGKCDFVANGSGGNKFGWFTISARGIKINTRNRRMFKDNGWDRIEVNHDNFYELCHPVIGMNTNYSGQAFALENTLIHEMCHYYTYCFGIAPKQCHGPEFRNIANVVTQRGNLEYRIGRFGDKDRNERGYRLDDKIKQQKEKRRANRISNSIIVLTQMKNGEARLTRAANWNVVNEIIDCHKDDGRAIRTYVYNDADVINYFANKGYVKTQRTYRCWTLNGSFDDIIAQLPESEPIDKVNYDDMNYENYKRDIVDVITERAVTSIKNKYGLEDSVAITPGMDLSEYSPLEL